MTNEYIFPLEERLGRDFKLVVAGMKISVPKARPDWDRGTAGWTASVAPARGPCPLDINARRQGWAIVLWGEELEGT